MIRRLCISLSVALALLGAMVLQAQDISSQESRRSALQRDIAKLEKQIQENASKSSNALNELTLVREQISTHRNLVEESEREVRMLQVLDRR